MLCLKLYEHRLLKQLASLSIPSGQSSSEFGRRFGNQLTAPRRAQRERDGILLYAEI